MVDNLLSDLTEVARADLKLRIAFSSVILSNEGHQQRNIQWLSARTTSHQVMSNLGDGVDGLEKEGKKN